MTFEFMGATPRIKSNARILEVLGEQNKIKQVVCFPNRPCRTERWFCGFHLDDFVCIYFFAKREHRFVLVMLLTCGGGGICTNNTKAAGLPAGLPAIIFNRCGRLTGECTQTIEGCWFGLVWFSQRFFFFRYGRRRINSLSSHPLTRIGEHAICFVPGRNSTIAGIIIDCEDLCFLCLVVVRYIPFS